MRRIRRNRRGAAEFFEFQYSEYSGWMALREMSTRRTGRGTSGSVSIAPSAARGPRGIVLASRPSGCNGSRSSRSGSHA